MLELSVYSYYQNSLFYRMVNGTDENKELEGTVRLYRDGESIPVFEEKAKYKKTLYAHRPSEDSVMLKERLLPGKYRLEMSGYETEFEIR